MKILAAARWETHRPSGREVEAEGAKLSEVTEEGGGAGAKERGSF